MGPAEMTRRMVAAVSNPHVDVLGHCTGRSWLGAAGLSRRSTTRLFLPPAPPTGRRWKSIHVPIAGTRPKICSSGSGGRLPVFHRLRCSRPGPAFVAPAGLRASGPGRDLVGADCQRHAPRPAAGLDEAPLTQSAAFALTRGGHFFALAPQFGPNSRFAPKWQFRPALTQSPREPLRSLRGHRSGFRPPLTDGSGHGQGPRPPGRPHRPACAVPG